MVYFAMGNVDRLGMGSNVDIQTDWLYGCNEKMPADWGQDAKREMPEALDNGSQPYSRAYGYGEMAGRSDTPFKTLPLGKGQEQRM